MADFQRFLKGLASVGRENQKFGIVLGNESGDLDSVASTLVLAKTLTEANPVPYLPVMNFRREDLSLRTESLFCLQELLRLDPETLQLLPFLDDPNRWSAESLDEKLSEVILVDHNVINTPEMKFLECKVSKIFDHRAMERAGPAQEGVQIKNETVGSCATLIAEYIFSKECKNKVYL